MKLNKSILIPIFISSLPVLLSACGKVHGERDKLPTGALPASQVKAGLPERLFHDALLSYTQDNTPAANVNGKTQYLSRATERGARFVIQCADNRCIMVQAYYLDNPIPKEQALTVLRDLMPDYTEPLTKIDTGVVQSGDHAVKAEIYEYGMQQAGCLIYTDSNTNLVKMVNASTLKPQELAAWFSIKLKEPSAPSIATKTQNKTANKTMSR